MQDDYWSLWLSRGDDWKKLFALIDPAIEGFIETQKREGRKVDVLRYRWDAPDRSLEFPSPQGGGIWNKIDLLIVGSPGTYTLRFSCAAWKDEERGPRSPRRRMWCHSSSELERQWELSLEKDLDFLRGAVEKRTKDVFKTVSSWMAFVGSEEWKGHGLIAEKPALVP